MSGEPKTLTLTLDEFEATARDITYQWMQHVGHGHEDVEFYERLLDEDTPVDEGDPNHDALRELEDTSEMVVFVMERLANLPLVGVPLVARDEAAELREENERMRKALNAVDSFLSHEYHRNGHRLTDKEWAANVLRQVEAITRRRLADGESEK